MTPNDILNELTARDDDDLWATYDEAGVLLSLHIGPEPEFPQDENLLQINISNLSAYTMDQQIANPT